VVRDGRLIAGVALPIRGARIRFGARAGQEQELATDAKSAVFRTELPKGRTRLYTWFLDEGRQPLLGAYYVYVRRMESRAE
jgi:hypothetical protein